MTAPRKKAAKRSRWPSSSRVSNLPHHVLMEILCRLPIKTLLSCKCVCKLWLKLISTDSHFVKLHLQRSPSELLFLSSSPSCDSIRFYMGNIQFHSNSAPSLKLSILFDFPKFSVSLSNSLDYRVTERKQLHFVNSCNGLVCFHNDFDNDMYAVICNPITAEFITVPAPKRGRNIPQLVAYGLGFSGKANRYKLLRLMKHKEYITVFRNEPASKLFAEICVFEKGSSWRNVGESPYFNGEVTSSLNSVFLEGKLHIRRSLSTGSYTAISCFDFDNELFEEVPFPPDEIDHHSMHIGILGGCLFISHYRRGPKSCVDIWVMKEYGVKDSWTKAFSVAKYNDNPFNFFFESHVPIERLDIGEILMLHQYNHLVLHNPVVNSFRTVGHIDNFEVNAYSPSLLLLKDALMGYDAKVYDVNFRSADMERQKLAAISWWEIVEKNFVQKSPQQQGSEAPLTNDDIHVPTTIEERQRRVSRTGVVASSSATHVTTGVSWEQMETTVEKLRKELRKERQQRQELEQRLQNENEHLKQQNQKLEESLRKEQAKVEQLKEQIQLKQENQRMALQLVEEVRAHLAGSH